MAGKRLELGPTGKTVGENVKRLRGGLSYTDLSHRLALHGRDIPPLAVRRIEQGERRVDIDDLVALSLALGVSPATMLVPNSSHRDCAVSATGLTESVDAEELWSWVTAAQPLPNTVSVFEFWGAAWPEFLRKLAWDELEKNRRVLPPSALLVQPKDDSDGNNR